jgi:lipoprotein-releasing system ATP-binding protein
MADIGGAFEKTADKEIISAPPLICGRRLCKSFSHSGALIEILRSVDLEIGSGETLAIVGASGIGKSTLLNILGTLDRPDSGNLLFQGEEILRYDDEKLARFRNVSVGFVFQFHHLLPEFTAIENTMMPALIKGDSRDSALESAEGILLRVGLKDRLQHRVVELSGGEQQRVALARALVLKPLVLLADEPTGNLDKRNSEKIHTLLLELNSEFHMTLVVVTHNMELAAIMSRRLTIVDGNLVETV